MLWSFISCRSLVLVVDGKAGSVCVSDLQLVRALALDSTTNISVLTEQNKLFFFFALKVIKTRE